jgi:hypothetical protein
MKLVFAAAAIAPLLFSSIDGQAGEIFDEIRFGGSGLIDSDSSKDRGFVGSAEAFFAPFSSSEDGLHKALTPRVQVGVSGGASATDQIYAGICRSARHSSRRLGSEGLPTMAVWTAETALGLAAGSCSAKTSFLV